MQAPENPPIASRDRAKQTSPRKIYKYFGSDALQFSRKGFDGRLEKHNVWQAASRGFPVNFFRDFFERPACADVLWLHRASAGLELKRRNAERALISGCVGGGQGVAMILERK